MRLRAPLYLAGVASVAVNAAMIWPLLGRVMPPEDIGALASILALAALLAPVGTAGLHVFAVRFAAGGTDEERASAERVTVAAALPLSVMAAAALVLGQAFADLAWVAGGCLAAQSVSLLSLGLLRGMDLPTSFALVSVTVQVLSLLSIFAITLAGGDLNTAIGVSAVIVLLAALIGLLPVAFKTRALSPGAMRQAWCFSLPLIPHLVLALAIGQGVRLLVAIVDGLEAAASFQYAAIVGGGGVTLVAALASHWGTDVLRVDRNIFAPAVQRMVRRLLLSSMTIALTICVFLVVGFDAWLPPGIPRREVALAITCLIPAAFAQALGDGAAAVCLRHNLTARLSIATAVGAGSALLLFYGVRPMGGVIAAALAVTGALIVRAVSVAALISPLGSAGQFARPRDVLMGGLAAAVSTAAGIFTALTWG